MFGAFCWRRTPSSARCTETMERQTEPQAGVARQEVIRVAGSRKSYGAHEVLRGVSLTARRGDVIAMIGGSGSGKSTTLRRINFLETPSAGEIVIGGERVVTRPDGSPAHRKQIERLRRSLEMVFQQFNLWAHKAVLQNPIEVPVHVLGVRICSQGPDRGRPLDGDAEVHAVPTHPAAFGASGGSANPRGRDDSPVEGDTVGCNCDHGRTLRR